MQPSHESDEYGKQFSVAGDRVLPSQHDVKNRPVKMEQRLTLTRKR